MDDLTTIGIPSTSLTTVIPTTHPGTVYFPDGNIALVASQDSQNRVIFRVYKGVLAARSPVFEGMLSLPAHGTTEEFDGVPLVFMQDQADHLQLLLEALYLGKELPSQRFSPHTPAEVRPVLELCRKYQIDSLQNSIIARLEEDWPTSLDGWDILEGKLESMKAVWSQNRQYYNDSNDAGPEEYFDNLVPEPAAAIRLARDFDIPSILPAAFYTLSRITIDQDYDQARVYAERTSSPIRTARWRLLTAEDFRNLLEGQARLKDVTEFEYSDAHEELLHFYAPDPDTTPLPANHLSSCTDKIRTDVMVSVWEAPGNKGGDVLHLLRPYEKHYGRYTRKICSHCSEKFVAAIHKLRKDIWNKLPEHFGVSEPTSDSDSIIESA